MDQHFFLVEFDCDAQTEKAVFQAPPTLGIIFKSMDNKVCMLYFRVFFLYDTPQAIIFRLNLVVKSRAFWFKWTTKLFLLIFYMKQTTTKNFFLYLYYRVKLEYKQPIGGLFSFVYFLIANCSFYIYIFFFFFFSI